MGKPARPAAGDERGRSGWRSARCALLLLPALLWTTACSTGAASGPGDAGTQDLLPSQELPTLSWGPCPAGFRSECAEALVPVDWATPEGERIPVLIAREPALRDGSPQLWLLQGGPGGTAASFESLIEPLAQATGMSVYTLEHRGVGGSSGLACPEAEPSTPEGWAACAENLQARWSTTLQHFTTTAAARDLDAVLRAPRSTDDEPALLWGVSYGAVWALRYLHLAPDGVQGVVLDSLPAPGRYWFSRYDEQFDPVARALMELCVTDDTCHAKLGDAPWDRLEALYERLDTTDHCAGLLAEPERVSLRRLLGRLLKRPDGRTVALAIVYRLERCTRGDRNAIRRAYAHFFGSSSKEGDESGGSRALFWHIALSEQWETPAPSARELAARLEPLLFSRDLAAEAPDPTSWPRYALDELVGRWPDTDTPILVLNGTLDPQTPLAQARAAQEHLTGAHQTFVALPHAPHAPGLSSFAGAPELDGCAASLALHFLAAPTDPLELGCVEATRRPRFRFDAETSQWLVGEDDLWENGSTEKGTDGESRERRRPPLQPPR